MDNKSKKIKTEINLDKFVTILCQQTIEYLGLLNKDNPEKLSQSLCALLGETLKTTVAINSMEKQKRVNSGLLREFNIALSSNKIQPREKLILESMLDFRKPLDDLFKILSYQSDGNTCAAVINNVSDLLQVSGNYNASFEIIGRYIERFERDDPEMLQKLDQGGNYFFSYHSIIYQRRGLHTLDKIPKTCHPPVINHIPNPVSKRITYFYAINSLSNNLLGHYLENGNSEYMDSFIIEGLRRKMDADFLKPILAKYFKDKKVNSFSFSMLTHLPWGGKYLSLFKPLLISEKNFKNYLNDSSFLCSQLELAAHVGEIELAKKIHKLAFDYAFENDFGNDNADYFYQACMAADLFDEADQWLYEGYPDEFDLPSALYNSADYLCSRGWELEDVLDTAGPEVLDSRLVASKWANGFDVSNDIKYLLDSDLCSGFEKIRSLSFLNEHHSNQIKNNSEDKIIFHL